jgi:hypothetical protein
MSVLSDSEPSPTEIHDVLRNDRRRQVLAHLRERLGRAGLGELADAIAATEAESDSPPSGVRQSVYNSLRQTHLPRLERAGVVSYDRNRQEVALEADVRYFDRHMEVSTDLGVTWAGLYRTLALVGFVAILAVRLDAPVAAAVDVVVPTSVFLVLLSAVTLSQLWTQRWRYLWWLRR